MQRLFLAIVTLLVVTGCTPAGSIKTSAWLITSSTTEIPLFRKGNRMLIKPDSIVVAIGPDSRSYAVIMSGGRLLFNDGATKWLFSMEVSSDRIILTGLYLKDPIIITLTKLSSSLGI